MMDEDIVKFKKKKRIKSVKMQNYFSEIVELVVLVDESDELTVQAWRRGERENIKLEDKKD